MQVLYRSVKYNLTLFDEETSMFSVFDKSVFIKTLLINFADERN